MNDPSNQVLLSLGTYISSMTIAEGSGEGAAHWTNFGSRPGQFLAESEGIRRGMWTVSWLRSLRESHAAGGDDLYALDQEMGRLAESVPAGSEGVAAVLDWLAPGDAPWRRGALVGFSGPQGWGHLYRAIFEAIAFTMADHIQAMAHELGRSFDSAIVTGGGANSTLLTQILADVLGMPVTRPLVSDAAAIGAAVCAAVGANIFPDWDTAVGHLVREGSPTTPGENSGFYQKLLPWHRGIRQRISDLDKWSTGGIFVP